MGPGSDNPGYAGVRRKDAPRHSASMGPGSDNPGYVLEQQLFPLRASQASMGPGSDNPGYGSAIRSCTTGQQRLQWVQGPITLVMVNERGLEKLAAGASMGPGSDNPGYAWGRHPARASVLWLQWVQGPITLVMAIGPPR